MSDTDKIQDTESFRDSIATIGEDGKRRWIYPKKPKGKFTTARGWVAILLLIFLFGAPFVKVGGQPLLLFNLLERKFIIFGQAFWPQDFYLFGLGMIILVVFIALFTVVYGRLFCGWVCPQTIFMENVFRRVEYFIEGDWKQQMKLNRDPWTNQKIFKKTSKHIIFFAISFIIANTFLAYIVGIDELINIVTSPVSEHVGGLAAISVFSGLFYGVFAFMREQVCTTICPYGRLQGVMLDRQSIVVAYDRVRGESRGRFRKNEDRDAVGKGDCIDCMQCVNVCPTGIDIRDGTQLECVNCTVCMDACDEMMVAVNLPTGLIRYTSEEQIGTRKPFKFSTRGKAYSALLVVLMGVMVSLLVTRTAVELNILRTPGMLFQKNDDGSISNLYNYKVINKTNREMNLSFVAADEGFEIKLVGQAQTLHEQSVAQGAFFVSAPESAFEYGKALTKIHVYDAEGNLIDKVKVRITGPL